MGRNIKVSEIKFDKWTEENNDPKSAQYHFNKLVTETGSELNERMKKRFLMEKKVDYKEPGFLSGLRKFMTDISVEGLLGKAILLSILGDATGALIDGKK